jgi:hypothetical protein
MSFLRLALGVPLPQAVKDATAIAIAAKIVNFFILLFYYNP